MRRWTWLFACLLVLTSGACDSSVDPDNPFDPESSPANQARGVVKGRLVAPEGVPQSMISGMTLTLSAIGAEVAAKTADVDESGVFVFDEVPAGDWLLRAQGGELYLPQVSFTMPIGESVDVGLLQTALRAAEGVLTGEAHLIWGSEGAHGGILVAVKGGLAQARTLADGSFTLRLPRGRHDLEFSYPNYSTATLSAVEVGAETSLEAPVVLNGLPIRVQGRVNLEGLESAERTSEVRVVLKRGDESADVAVSGLGLFRHDDLSPGVYTLEASRSGYVSVERSFQVKPGDFEDVGQLVLRHHSRTGDAEPLRGRIRSVGAASQAGVEVTVRLAGSELVLGQTITDANGDFTVLASPDERYVFTADRPDYVPFTSRESYGWDEALGAFVDEAGGEAKADLLAEDPRGSVTFDVGVGPAWLPLESRTARVLISRRGEALPELVGSDNQRIRVDNLQPGTYRLLVARPGFTEATAEFEVVNAPGELDVLLESPLEIRLDNLTESGIELGREVQAEWFEGVEVAGATLSRRTLIGDFGGLDLTGVRLPDSDLTQASFAGALMSGADLSRVVATGTGFVGADLTGALFAGARLDGARFHCAERLGDGRCACEAEAEACVTLLTGASFSNASVAGTDFSGALLDESQFTGAIFGLSDEGTALSPPLGCDLPLACRWGALEACEALPEGCRGVPTRFTGASLVRATMPGAVLEHVDFSDSDLREANLNNTTITFNTHLRRADLTGAQLRVARLNGADLREATLVEAVLSDADLTGADLSAVDAAGVVLQGADLSRTVLKGVQMQGAQMQRALFAPDDALGARLEGAELSGATLVSRSNTGPLYMDGATLDGARLQGAFWGWSFREISGRNLQAQNGAIQLIGCDFTRADLTEAILILGNQGVRDTAVEFTLFTNADLTNAQIVTLNGIQRPIELGGQRTKRPQCHPGTWGGGTPVKMYWTDYEGATLDGALISDFEIRGGNFNNIRSAVEAEFIGNQIELSSFHGSNLSQSQFSHNWMFNIDARQVNFEETSLELNHIEMMDARESDFSRAGVVRTKIHLSIFQDAVMSGANLYESCLGHSTFHRVDFRGAGASLSRWNSSDVVSADFTGATMLGASNLSTPFSDIQIESMLEHDWSGYDEGDLRIYAGEDLTSGLYSGLPEQALDICASGGTCHEMAASCAPYEDEIHTSCQDMNCIMLLNGGCDNPEAFFGECLNLEFCDIIPQDPSILVDTCPMYEGAVFIDSNLQDVDMSDSDMEWINFTRANLRGFQFPPPLDNHQQLIFESDMVGSVFQSEERYRSGVEYVWGSVVIVDTPMDGLSGRQMSFSNTYMAPTSVENVMSHPESGVMYLNNTWLSNAGPELVRLKSVLLDSKAHYLDLSGVVDREVHNSVGSDIKYAVFDDAQLKNGVRYVHSDMSSLSAHRFSTSMSDFEGSCFHYAEIVDSQVAQARFQDTVAIMLTLDNTDVSGSDFSGSMLVDLMINGAILDESNLSLSRMTIMSGRGTSLERTDLRSFDFSGVDMSEASLRAANAEGAVFTRTVLERADLRDGHFAGAVFSESQLNAALLTGGDFQGARMSGADLRGGEVGSANLSWADLTNARLSGVDLRSASLMHVRLSEADLTGAQVCRSQLEGATTGDWSVAVIDEGC